MGVISAGRQLPIQAPQCKYSVASLKIFVKCRMSKNLTLYRFSSNSVTLLLMAKQLNEAQIPEIWETDEERKLSDREIKKSNKKYAQETFQGKKYINKEDNKEISVARKGLDKWDNITKSREQSLSIKRLNELLENCKKERFEPDDKNRRSVKGFTYYKQLIKVNEQLFVANLAIMDTDAGSSYYYHFLIEA